MTKKPIVVAYLLVMITTVVVVDLTFFRDLFWERLIANVSIIAVFVAIYFIFLGKRR